MSATSFQRYLENTDMHKLLNELAVPNAQIVLKALKHFTQKEAEKRDKILTGYFGEEGINLIVDSIARCLLSKPKLQANAQILDVGAGSGLFTTKVAAKLHVTQPEAKFYAMDVTPIMLQMLARKTSNVQPFLGVAENISKSAQLASRQLRVPMKFDAAFSTLMLHHCANVEKVFESIQEPLKPKGKAVVVDLCKHGFEEFREEMGDVHLGFDPKQIEKAAKKWFTSVSVDKLPGICCSSSGRCAELFIAYMTV